MSRSNHTSPPEPISDRRHVLIFGKFAGETVQDILDNDPGYIVWLQDNTENDFAWDILEEARKGPQHTFTGFTKRYDPR